MQVLPCPKCNRFPQITDKLNGKYIVHATCRPFVYLKPHLEVMVVEDDLEQAISECIFAWNENVKLHKKRK